MRIPIAALLLSASLSTACSSSSDGGGDPPGAGAAAPATATVSGRVLRVAATKPVHGGKGDVYVAIFAGNPVADAAHATLVGQAVVSGADMNSDDAAASFTIAGVPIAATPYQAVAFLDDDGNAQQGPNAAPTSGDLVSLSVGDAGIGGVPVAVTSAADVHVDLPLTAAMP